MKPIEHIIVAVEGFEGLVQCTTCGAAEGELLTFCPGYRLNADARDACFDGNIIDIRIWRLTRIRKAAPWNRR
jgi:hypothetical protein